MTDPSDPNLAPPARRRLGPAQLDEALAALPGWHGGPDQITCEVRAPSFPAAIELVAAVAAVAETLDHHPDIDIRWRTVRLVLSTHSSGGVTETDLVAARAFSEVIAESGAGSEQPSPPPLSTERSPR